MSGWTFSAFFVLLVTVFVVGAVTGGDAKSKREEERDQHAYLRGLCHGHGGVIIEDGGCGVVVKP